jgi:hypothetical protein
VKDLHLLRLAIFEDLKRAPIQIGKQLAALVGNAGMEHDQPGICPELRQQASGQKDRAQQQQVPVIELAHSSRGGNKL